MAISSRRSSGRLRALPAATEPLAHPRLAARGIRMLRGKHEVLKGIDLEVGPGECLGIAGPNAAGKSTLLGVLAGWLHPTEGEVELDGHHVHGRVPPEIGYAAQEVSLYPHLTGRANLELFAKLYDLSASERAERIARLSERLELDQWLDHEMAHVSGGVARRFHLAIALVNDPKVVLLDEPTAGLDPGSRRQLLDAIVELLAEGKTVVITSQVLGDLEFVSHRLMLLVNGERRLYERIDELADRIGGGVLTVEIAQHDLGAVELGAVPGVLEWHLDGSVLTARVSDPGIAIAGVVEWLEARGLHAVRVEVEPPSLESFLRDVVPSW